MVAKRIRGLSRGTAGSAAVTGIAAAAATGAAALGGAVLARKFGASARTDGFFAAYAVYLVVVLAASALRLVVMPELARAAALGRLGEETAAWAAAVALPCLPIVVVTTLAADAVAGAVTSTGQAQATAASAFIWLGPAAVAQVYAALAAGALAAVDDYATAAIAFLVGAVAGVALFVALADAHGPVALAWGLALNGAVSVAVPGLRVLQRCGLRRPGRRALDAGRRLSALARGMTLPLALQALYVVAVAFAGAVGVGAATSLSYAYLIATSLVIVTAVSLSLVSSVPLTRQELRAAAASQHIVSASLLSLVVVVGAAGAVAVAGDRVVALALGDRASTIHSLGPLVASLGPWMVASICVSITYPLLFVTGRAGWLPIVAVGTIAVDIPIEWAGRALWGLPGISAGLAVTTFVSLVALLVLLSHVAALDFMSEFGRGAVFPVVIASVAFGGAALALPSLAAAGVGLVLYAATIVLGRPRRVGRALAYVRSLA